MSDALLEATHISHSFDYTLFTDINFKLTAHNSAAIVGRSGSGKSTLLHLLGNKSHQIQHQPLGTLD